MADSQSAIKKITRQVEIKSDGDAFFEIYKQRPYEISSMSPCFIQNVQHHEGERGTVGSIHSWHYTHEGKEKVAKTTIEAIDDGKRSVCYKMIGGDLMNHFDFFTITVHVDKHGDSNLVTWTFHYDKVKDDVAEPHSLMDFCIAVTKDIEKHLLNN